MVPGCWLRIEILLWHHWDGGVLQYWLMLAYRQDYDGQMSRLVTCCEIFLLIIIIIIIVTWNSKNSVPCANWCREVSLIHLLPFNSAVVRMWSTVRGIRAWISLDCWPFVCRTEPSNLSKFEARRWCRLPHFRRPLQQPVVRCFVFPLYVVVVADLDFDLEAASAIKAIGLSSVLFAVFSKICISLLSLISICRLNFYACIIFMCVKCYLCESLLGLSWRFFSLTFMLETLVCGFHILTAEYCMQLEPGSC